MEQERERGGRMGDEQKITMIEFMEEHLDFARGNFSGNEGKIILQSLWEVLATRLNLLEGPKKSTAKWKRVWIDQRNKTKRKAREVRASRLKTGGDPSSYISLSEIDDRIVAIMSEQAVYGLSETNGTDEQLPSCKNCATVVTSTNLHSSAISTSAVNSTASTSFVNRTASTNFENPTASTNFEIPTASTSFTIPVKIITVPSPCSSDPDHLESFESDESALVSESEFEGNDDGMSSQPTNKRTEKNWFQACVENSESLNKKMDKLIDVMYVLAEEKKKQTALMEELVKLKRKKYSNI